MLSGNRNFEGRIHPLVQMNFLASPPLVVAYALAGKMDVDLFKDPLGTGSDGKPVYLKDIWPSQAEIQEVMLGEHRLRHVQVELRQRVRRRRRTGTDRLAERRDLRLGCGLDLRQEPALLRGHDAAARRRSPTSSGARVLALLGDSVTTDHISPAGSIAADSPAAEYLRDNGVEPRDFNSYGSRRGNHEVMMRGTFANIRLRNQLAPGTEGGWTRHQPSGEQMSIYDASMRYQQEGTPLVVIAGKEYGTGSSRDWAAKGTLLLGVRAVIAESFERIHRSNLIGMGVLPLQFVTARTRHRSA